MACPATVESGEHSECLGAQEGGEKELGDSQLSTKVVMQGCGHNVSPYILFSQEVNQLVGG